MSSTDVAALTRRLERTFAGRCVRRFITMQGFDRSLVLASQAFTALIPLLILASTLAPVGKESVISDSINKKFGLEGDSAAAVDQLFTIPAGATSSLSVLSVLLLLFSGVSFTRRMQRMYQAAWGQEKAGVRGGLFAALGLVVLLAEAVLLSMLRTLASHIPFDWLVTIPLSAATGLVLWTSIPYLLLNRKVHWRRLLVGGGIAATATTIYSIATTIYMPPLVERYTNEFGLFGITIAIIGWLLAICGVTVATTALGAEFDRADDPWVRYLKRRFHLVDPAFEAALAEQTSAHEGEGGARVAPDSSPAGDDPGAEDFENPFMLRRIVINLLIIAAAVWVVAAIIPGIEVHGGFFTYLWVSLLFGLVNAVLGPILHLIALPLTALTFGLFALVVNGVLLAVTAGLTDDLDVGGFVGTILGALLISIVTAVLGLLFSPVKQDA